MGPRRISGFSRLVTGFSRLVTGFSRLVTGFSRLVVFIIIWPDFFIHHDVLSRKVHYIFHDLSARPHRFNTKQLTICRC